jgi:hypothetical protein
MTLYQTDLKFLSTEIPLMIDHQKKEKNMIDSMVCLKKKSLNERCLII